MVTFISYDGKYLNFCYGTLVVDIDGKKVTFGDKCQLDYEKRPRKKHADYPSFWRSSGSVSFDSEWNELVLDGEWQLDFDEKDYPKDIVMLMPELIRVFNENVINGCCGGCV